MSKQSEQTRLEQLRQQRQQLQQEIAEIQRTIDDAVQDVIKLDRKMIDESSRRRGLQSRRAA